MLTGGDAAKSGLMTMNDERWQRTRDFMVSAKLLKPETDHRRAYTLELVNGVRVLP